MSKYNRATSATSDTASTATEAPVTEEVTDSTETATTESTTESATESPTETVTEAAVVEVVTEAPAYVNDIPLAVATDLISEYDTLAKVKTPTSAQLKTMAISLTQIVNYGINVKKDTFHEGVMKLLYGYIKDNINLLTNDNYLYRGFNLLGNNQNESAMLTSRLLRMMSTFAKGAGSTYTWDGLKASVTPAIFSKLRLLVK